MPSASLLSAFMRSVRVALVVTIMVLDRKAAAEPGYHRHLCVLK